MTIEQRRADDRGWMCTLALRCSQAWDWIDARDIDKHAVALSILYGTVRVLRWSFMFAEAHMDKSGVELAAVIGAVTAPYMALQAAAIAFYFKARA